MTLSQGLAISGRMTAAGVEGEHDEFDRTEGGSCEETFTRVVGDGLGTSEFGPAWQYEPDSIDVPLVAVDGAKATFAAEPAETMSSIHWVDVWSAGDPLPREVLIEDLMISWCADTDNYGIVLALDSQPDPPGSEFFLYLDIQAEAGGALGARILSISPRLESSQGGFDEEDELFPSGPLDDASQYDLHLNVRIRIEAGAVRARLWKVGDAEPGTWTLEDDTNDESELDQVASVGWYMLGLSHFSEPGFGETNASVSGVSITEGCIGSALNWGLGPWQWLSTAEMMEGPPFGADDSFYAVNGAQALMSYGPEFDSHALGPQQGLFFPEGLAFPIQIEYEISADRITPGDEIHNLQLYLGPSHYNDEDTWLSFLVSAEDGAIGGTFDVGNGIGPSPGFDPDTNLEGFNAPDEPDDASLASPHRVKIEIDASGGRMKLWKVGDAEPDWRLSFGWDVVPDRTMFRYLYFETQNIADSRPITVLEYFALGGEGGQPGMYGNVSIG